MVLGSHVKNLKSTIMDLSLTMHLELSKLSRPRQTRFNTRYLDGPSCCQLSDEDATV